MRRLFLILTLLISVIAFGKDTDINKMNLNMLSPLSVSGGRGLSGHFAGVVDGKIIVAGGCNFPNVPAAEGGEKVFTTTFISLKTLSRTTKTGNPSGNCQKPWPTA